MNSTRTALGPRGASTGWAFGAALALFAVLCGVGLLLASGEQPERRSDAARSQIAEALGELERATQAIDAADYGVARTRLLRARATLTELLPQRRASR